MDQALNSQKTPHTSPLRASYGMSFVSILMKNDRVIKGFYCTLHNKHRHLWLLATTAMYSFFIYVHVSIYIELHPVIFSCT